MTMIGFNASYSPQPSFGKRRKKAARGGQTAETQRQLANEAKERNAEKVEAARIQRSATNESLIGKKDARKGEVISKAELIRRATAPKFEGWA